MRHPRALVIEEKADEILRTTEMLRVPIPVGDVARRLGLRVSPANLTDDVSGMLVIEEGRGSIGYNSGHPPVRQRFTIAHELAHFVLHHSAQNVFIDKKQHTAMFRRDHRSSTGNDIIEIEANQFAAALLMPRSLILQEIIDLDFDLADEDTLRLLALRFGVSTQAMSIRLGTIGVFESEGDELECPVMGVFRDSSYGDT